MQTFETVPLARYRFEFEVTRPISLPDYAGSMLRGAFGHALRELSCLTRQKECAGCALINACPYQRIFSPRAEKVATGQHFSQIPVPYVIEPPAWGARILESGQTLSFHMVLIGKAINELPLILLAWRRAFMRGIGRQDGGAQLRQLFYCPSSTSIDEQRIYCPKEDTLHPHPKFALPRLPKQTPEALILKFTTPLRLQQNGHALPPARLSARTLLMALLKRASHLAEFHTDTPISVCFSSLAALASELHEQRTLSWRDWGRYSSRQKQEMKLGGVVGTWRLEGNLAPLINFLQLGQWIHIGKETAFGLGQYQLYTTTGDIFDKNSNCP